MSKSKPIYACDAETDPFLHGRVPEPFLWGLYNGKDMEYFETTEAFVRSVYESNIILYAHNGGKFDFMFMLPYLGETKAQVIGGRIVSMFLGRAELRDSYATIPEALAKFGGKREIEFWKLEKHVRKEHMPEIREYLFYDCKTLYDGMVIYRDVVGKHKTIASNALAYSRKLGINPGKSNYRFDSKYRPFYYGGRTECFQPGTHKNIKIIDIRSAYPFAMLNDHATGTEFGRVGSLDSLTREQIQRSFIEIECTSRGAFPKRTPEGLSFPHEYDHYHVTGWEYIAAKELGLISNEKIHSVRATEKTINFKDYINFWYEKKQACNKETDPLNYLINKRMMNSLSGKLSQNPANYYDYKILKAGTRSNPLKKGGAICEFSPSQIDSGLCEQCGQRANDHGWNLMTEFGDHEIHRRESLWKHKFELGAEWEAKPIFNNVATGASITGFTRAHLLRAAHGIVISNVIYCDTDSLICKEQSDLSGIPLDDAIGSWELEDACAPLGHFAGKKLYGIKLSSGKHKIASKGSKLTFDHMLELLEGKTVTWKSDAPTFGLDGQAKFVTRNIRATSLPVTV